MKEFLSPDLRREMCQKIVFWHVQNAGKNAQA